MLPNVASGILEAAIVRWQFLKIVEPAQKLHIIELALPSNLLQPQSVDDVGPHLTR
jgi:hypothetical protein